MNFFGNRFLVLVYNSFEVLAETVPEVGLLCLGARLGVNLATLDDSHDRQHKHFVAHELTTLFVK
jgi:hypothetical protein